MDERNEQDEAPATVRPRSEIAAVLALAHGRGVKRAAEASGLSTRTITRRLKSKSFQRRIHKMRSMLFSRAAGMLVNASIKAVRALVEIIEDKNVKPNDRLTAARIVLENGNKFGITLDADERLAELEAGKGSNTDGRQQPFAALAKTAS